MAQVEQSSQGPSFLMDPQAGSQSYGNVLSSLMSRLPGAPPSYQDMINQGLNSPLINSVLQPAMNNLNDQFGLQNQQFNDEFRSAGALGSGAQAVGMGRLAQAQGNAQGNLIAQVISQMLPQFTQGLNQQYQNQLAVPGLLGSILGQTRPLVGQAARTSSSVPAAGGSPGLSTGASSQRQTSSNQSDNFGLDYLNDYDLSGLGSEGGGGYDYSSYYPGLTSYGPDGVIQSDTSDSGLLGYGQGYLPSGEEDVGQPIFSEEY